MNRNDIEPTLADPAVRSHFVDGAFRAPRGETPLPTVDPSTGRTLATFVEANDEEVDEAFRVLHRTGERLGAEERGPEADTNGECEVVMFDHNRVWPVSSSPAESVAGSSSFRRDLPEGAGFADASTSSGSCRGEASSSDGGTGGTAAL